MSAYRKYLDVTLFVAVWMAVGWALHLDPNAYLLLGVPLVTIFQLLVRREPLQKLWVQNAASFRLDLIAVLLALCLMVVPAYELIRAWSKQNWTAILWFLSCIGGAVFAAFSSRHLQKVASRSLLLSFAAAVTIGCLLIAIAALTRGLSVLVPPPKFLSALKWFFLYFPACFALEEVVFRGALDTHVYQPGSAHPWTSALFVSSVWGLWHLPVLPLESVLRLTAAVPAMVLLHCLIGVPLSFCWRVSGTLAVPAAAHALVDAYRNLLLGERFLEAL